MHLAPEYQNWVNLLRNPGQLTQGFGEFKITGTSDCYCSLGLFCLANNQPATIEERGVGTISNYDFVQKYFTKQEIILAVRMNDAHKFTLEEIADWGEAHFANFVPTIRK
jgi:hypothetical protein